MSNKSFYEHIPGFGERLCETIRQSGKSVKEIAKSVGRERKSIYAWEHNDNVPSAVALMNLARCLRKMMMFRYQALTMHRWYQAVTMHRWYGKVRLGIYA